MIGYMNQAHLQTDITDRMTALLDNPYLREAIMTATPEQLQLMLCDGAIRFSTQARDALQIKDYETSCDRLIRAQNIILEMQTGLRHEVNPELCGRVASLYAFLYRKLVDANLNRDIQSIDDALRILRMERETWQLLIERVNEVRAADTISTDNFSSQNEGRTPILSIES